MFELLTHPVVSGLLVMGVIGVLAYKAQFVDISGLVSAFVVGFTVWYTGGPPAFTIVLFFFLSSGVATKFKYKSKAKQGLAQEGKGKRSYKNVLASGIIPMIFSIAWFVAREFPDLGIPSFWMFGGFVGAVATTAADTLASEVGVFSSSKPRLITNLRRKVPRGTIGAVSLLGEGMAAMAGLAIGIIAVVFALVSPGTSWGSVPVSSFAELLFVIPLSVLTGFVGCNIDSLIGAALQNRFVCDICGAITDKEFHCGYETKYIGGFKRLTNVHVNLGSSTLGATLGIVLGAGLFVWVLGSLFFWIASSSSS